ncbi:vezatin-like isoform X2 [Mya arenaria]|uniref:vezatin-like isoform X2 n=1 Tax=Mya arenaria TaxID=6604 RepID=UPI0022E7A6E7|nr:vezatin-like isoform X2 [Mya arenaria]
MTSFDSQGSPLYDSLMKTGSLAEELYFVEKHHKKNLTYGDEEVSPQKKPRSVWMKAVSLFHLLRLFVSPKVFDIKSNCQKGLVTVLKTSPLLQEDDADFLHCYIRNVDQTETCQNIQDIVFKYLKNFSVPYLCSFIYLHMFRPNVLSTTSWTAPTSYSLAGICSTTLIISVWHTVTRFHQIYLHRDKIDQVEEFLTRNKNFTMACKKCLRLIQETELVARGFTLVSQRNPLSRLELNGKNDVTMVTRQCPGLRRLVFTVVRDAMLTYRSTIQKLLELYPLGSELDVKGSYLAYEPLKSYGPCLQEDIVDEELYSLTDGYSVVALKGVFHLFTLHQSEMIKSLALVYNSSVDIQVEKLHTFLMDTGDSLTSWTGSLQKAYDFNNSSWQTTEPVSRSPPQHSDGENVLVAVHSLDLHLQAALKRVRELSNQLEQSSDEGQSDANLKSHDFPSLMLPIKSELESCKGCWEEALLRIENVTGKVKKDVSPEGGNSAEKVEDKPPLAESPTREVEDYIIEDQVFEAYTDPNEVISDHQWEKPLTAEEKAKKKREREEAMRVLTELKSVISVRAVEVNKREQAALKKMYPQYQDDSETAQSKEERNGMKEGMVDNLGHATDGGYKSLMGSKDVCIDGHGKTDHTDNDTNGGQYTKKEIKNGCTDKSGKTDNKVNDSDDSGKIVSQDRKGWSVESIDKHEQKNIDGDKCFQETRGTEVAESEPEGINKYDDNVDQKRFDIFDKDRTEGTPANDMSAKTEICFKDEKIKDDLKVKFHSENQDLEDIRTKRDVNSYVSRAGVRRIRKSNMLEMCEMCDSDSDTEANKDIDYYYNDSDEEIEDSGRRIGLPLMDLIGNRKDKEVEPEEFGNESDSESADLDEFRTDVRMPMLTLEDRLGKLAGGNYGFSSDVASAVAARSRDLIGLTEETFGGEVYGELSEDEASVGDGGSDKDVGIDADGFHEKDEQGK